MRTAGSLLRAELGAAWAVDAGDFPLYMTVLGTELARRRAAEVARASGPRPSPHQALAALLTRASSARPLAASF